MVVSVLLIVRFVSAVVSLSAVTTVCMASVYKVGDTAGWTTIGNVDYKQWAALKNFKLGDVIHFEYNAQFHNVMHVTHADYKACNTTSPKATYTSGNDSITITTRGHHFFFCGVPGHCQAGQKVDINVPRISHPAAASSPVSYAPPPEGETTTSSSDSPTVPAMGVSGPSPNKGVAMNLGLAVGVAAAAAAAFAVHV